MNKVLLWDLDGTLLDSFGVYEGVLTEILLKQGLTVPSHETMLANFHGTLSDSIDHALGGVPLRTLDAIMAEFLLVQDTHYEVVEDHLFADALRLVKRAHEAGCKQILVTNREHEGRLKASPRHIVARSSLREYIDTVVCGDDSEHRKPKPEVLVTLAEMLKGAEVLVIGDQFVDAEFAQNLGASGVLVRRGEGEIAHINKLGKGWQQHIKILHSLDDVELP